MQTILVVDDERNIIELARLYLSQEGYKVLTSGNGREALEIAREKRPDLVVLDIMLPEMDGWEVCRRLSQESDVPVILLTARGEDVDRIVGLELGADDYVVKPFNPRELVARIKAVLRRSRAGVRTGQVHEIEGIRIDPASREVWVKGKRLGLRTKEFDLLLALAEHRGIVLTREQLLARVWGFDYYGQTRTVDVHVAQLRKRLRESGVVIETVRGVGYRLRENDSSSV